MITDLETIRKRIKSGDIEAGRWALISLLRRDPENADAWVLMATLTDDPARQADCYRRALRNDPKNKDAAAWLLSQMNLDTNPGEALRCPQCGGAMAVRRIGEMRDKRAVCLHCDTEVDLPDSFRRVVKKRTREKRLFGSRTVNETQVETRSDGSVQADNQESLPPELLKMMRDFDDQNFSIGKSSRSVEIKTDSWEDHILSEMFPGVQAERKRLGLSLDDIIQMAGGPLPPDKRRQCPNPKCNAIISKDDKKCPWCDQILE